MSEERANDPAVMFPHRYVVQDAYGYFHGSTQEISLVMAVCLLVYYILMFMAYCSIIIHVNAFSIWKDLPEEAG